MELKEPEVILIRPFSNPLHNIRVGVLNKNYFLGSVSQPARQEHLAERGVLLSGGGRRYQCERVALPDVGVTLDFESGRKVRMVRHAGNSRIAYIASRRANWSA
jgi:hypothetical protein